MVFIECKLPRISLSYLTLRKITNYVISINNDVPAFVFRYEKTFFDTIGPISANFGNKVQAAERERNLRFSNYNIVLKDYILVDYVILAIAAPNLTHTGQIGAGWCKRDKCERAFDDHFLLLNDPRSAFFINRKQKWSFVTCGGTDKNGISFIGYVSPFVPTMWGLVFVFYIVLWILVFFVAKRNKCCIPYMIGFLILLEQDSEVSDRNKIGHYIWVVIIWLLTGVVISNAYRGECVKDLTAPINKLGISSFEQLVELNFTIYSKPVFQLDFILIYLE
jgi:hypothetical protein